LNPFAIEKYKIQKRKTKCNKFQENLNDHDEKRKFYYKSQECHQSIYAKITNLKEKQNTSNPKIPMTVMKEI